MRSERRPQTHGGQGLGLGRLRESTSPSSGALGGSGAAGCANDKHRAYLQKLQERNHLHRLQREAGLDPDRLRREQGFSVCFSGANSRRQRAAASDPRRRSGAGSSGSGLPGSGAPSGGGGGGGGVWRQWEERTVEIRGDDGEVYAALRPTGERRQPSGGVPEGASGDEAEEVPEEVAEAGVVAEEAEVPEDVDEALKATLGATQQDLRLLLCQLAESGDLADEGDGDAPAEGAGEPPALAPEPEPPEAPAEEAPAEEAPAQEAPAASEEEADAGLAATVRLTPLPSPKPQDLAERIARLPKGWRGALVQLLEDAEAAELAGESEVDLSVLSAGGDGAARSAAQDGGDAPADGGEAPAEARPSAAAVQ